MSRHNQSRAAQSAALDPLAASRLNAQPVALPVAPVAHSAEMSEEVEAVAPPPVVAPARTVTSYRVLERIAVSNGGTMVMLPKDKIISTRSHGAEFIAKAARAGAKLAELPSS